MKKLIAWGGGIVFITALLPLASFAQTETSHPATMMSVTVNRNGKGRLEGTISSIAGSVVSVASWGGTWSVDASSAKTMLRLGHQATLSQFQTGDTIIAEGTFAQSGWAMTAASVRDMSIQERGASFSGTISNLNSTAQSFTLTTEKGKTYSVTAASNAKIWVNGKISAFSDLSNGTNAAVSGIWDRNGNTVTANSIRVRLPGRELRTLNSPASTSTAPNGRY